MLNNKNANSLLLEIQGLRAVAVLVVLIFHIWPSVLTGGYVGVDVFFVISGYLITSLLLRETERTGTISLVNFYARRIRRLLPASTVVILACASVGYLLPRVQWTETAKGILASTFYVQNWWLASEAVDYLAEDNAPGILQHYWSLSVEEQYYIFWPLLFLFSTTVFKVFKKHPKIIFGAIISLIAVVSFVYSIYLTNTNPPLAYFATTTRAWELAIGGLLAIILQNKGQIKGVLAVVVGWVGIFAIAASCVFYNEQTAFPGYTALLPTVGAALVIMAGSQSQWWSSYRLLATRFMQFIGDISYSLYLWHWPVIIIYKLQVSDTLKLSDGVSVICISILLAYVTKICVEDPFRHKNWKTFSSINQPITIASLSFAACLFAANYLWFISHGVAVANNITSEDNINDLINKPYDPTKPLIPDLLEARRDNPDVYRLKCHADQAAEEPIKCEFGDVDASYHVVLVGDSHAAQWLPSLQTLLESKKDWKITTFTKSACAFNSVPVSLGKERAEYTSCTEWNNRVVSELYKIRPDIVVTSQSSGHRAFGSTDQNESQSMLASGLLTRWRELSDMGLNVVVIRDTPWMDSNPVECLSAFKAIMEDCATKTSRAFKSDSIMLAMKENPPVSFIDLSKNICDTEWCWPVQGQVLLWRDRHHLTATYARVLASEFEIIFDLVD